MAGIPIENIDYFFFPLEDGEYEGGYNKSKNNGWRYVLENKDRLISTPMFTNLSQCHSPGFDYIIYNDECYLLDRTYHILPGGTFANPTVIIVGKRSKIFADKLNKNSQTI